MSWIDKHKSKRRSPAGLVAGVILTTTLALGTWAGAARAEEHEWEHRRHEWHERYYRAPPVVYGAPYYQPYYAPPPPVIYGPGFGLNFTIR